MNKILRVGSRKSKLALVQSNHIRSRIEHATGIPCEIVSIDTTGDRNIADPLPEIGTKGLFTKELEDKLIDGTLDLAVHSLKDLPTALPDGLVVGGVAKRETPNDVLLARSVSKLAELPEGATVATGSLRRRAFVLHHRPDLLITGLRGNVPTRVKKLHAGAADAMILAAAGLKRLGLESEATVVFPVDELVPAAGQGAIAIEIRNDRKDVRDILDRIADPTTELETNVERTVLASLEGGCHIPIGVHAIVSGNDLRIHASVSDVNGRSWILETVNGAVSRAMELADAITKQMIKRGADKIIASIPR